MWGFWTNETSGNKQNKQQKKLTSQYKRYAKIAASTALSTETAKRVAPMNRTCWLRRSSTACAREGELAPVRGDACAPWPKLSSPAWQHRTPCFKETLIKNLKC
jgi:hypothetical protein